jgi:hypothetical protein
VTQRVMVAKLTRLTHKIVIQLHLVAESCTICSSRSRQPIQKLLDTPSCEFHLMQKKCNVKLNQMLFEIYHLVLQLHYMLPSFRHTSYA